MKVLVCGSRNWEDRQRIKDILDIYHERFLFTALIEGEALGVDGMARDWAIDRHIPTFRFPAHWGLFGKSAGPIRNQQMLDVGQPDFVIAFHENIETSKGTADMVRRAKKAGIDTLIVGA